MESKKMMMMMMLVLVATFAVAAFASPAIEKDVITADAIHALSKSNKFPNEVINAKTLVPNLFLAETFLKPDAAHTDASIPCGESCVYIPCFTRAIGCSCRSKVCYRG